MKKLKINKIIVLTLSLVIAFSTVVSAKTIKDTNKLSKAGVQSIDPFPMEDTGSK